MPDSLPPPPALEAGAALLLDFDGTLVELAAAPDTIAVPSGLTALLDRLADRLSGRIAIVSGRSIADLERHAGPLAVALSGSHGLELRRADRAAEPTTPPKGAAQAQRAAARFAAAAPGLLAEDKPGGVALHYRAAPAREAQVAAFARALAQRSGLRVQPGKMVFELVPPGTGKGEAVRRLMAEPPFAGARPVFVGDDLTDENGFAAAAALGGYGVLVGPPRPTAAACRLADVAAVHAWLEAGARHG